MSDEPKEKSGRSPYLIAIIGGLSVIGAALIGVYPHLKKKPKCLYFKINGFEDIPSEYEKGFKLNLSASESLVFPQHKLPLRYITRAKFTSERKVKCEYDLEKYLPLTYFVQLEKRNGDVEQMQNPLHMLSETKSSVYIFNVDDSDFKFKYEVLIR